MDRFWVLTRMDENDQIIKEKIDNEDDAREAWYNAYRPLFLDEVRRLANNV